MELNEKKKKNNGKRGNKKMINQELLYDMMYYKEENDSINNYKNIEYLSSKEQQNFENKFSTPRNESQKRLLTCLKKKDYRIVLASGPAGTGKTLFGIEQGIKNYINGNYEKLIFTRPAVSVDEDLGYLPGTLEEKMAPWMAPIFDIIHNFISPKEVKLLMEDKIFEIVPLGMMRGRTFKNAWIVADEMQNSSISQMKMLLTRLGEGSRIIITGDLEQNDRHGEVNGLEDFLSKLKGRRSDSISSIEFDKCDIERDKIIEEVLDIYETNKIPYHYNVTESELEFELNAEIENITDISTDIINNNEEENIIKD
jgi:phosphate starvation-inducible PhoH-like protein